MVTHSYAQTNLQLYNQLLASGYDDRDLDLIRRCYNLVLQLFSGHVRGNGKPFVSHLVGTASILAGTRARTAVVGAGLLHAAYDHGDFGMQFPFGRRRERIRQATSVEVENLVERYSRLEWTDSAVPALRRSLPMMAPAQKDVILIRLANELEDSLDSGLLYHMAAKDGELLLDPHADVMVDLAEELQQVELASALAQARREYDEQQPPPEVLRSVTTVSYTVVSPSYGVRPTVRLGRTLFTYVRPALDVVYTLAASRRGGR